MKFLKYDDRATYAWRGNLDITILSTLLDANIRVLTVTYNEEFPLGYIEGIQHNPIREFFVGPQEANQNANLKKSVILLNEQNCHFNLLLPEEHPLVTKDRSTGSHPSLMSMIDTLFDRGFKKLHDVSMIEPVHGNVNEDKQLVVRSDIDQVRPVPSTDSEPQVTPRAGLPTCTITSTMMQDMQIDESPPQVNKKKRKRLNEDKNPFPILTRAMKRKQEQKRKRTQAFKYDVTEKPRLRKPELWILTRAQDKIAKKKEAGKDEDQTQNERHEDISVPAEVGVESEEQVTAAKVTDEVSKQTVYQWKNRKGGHASTNLMLLMPTDEELPPEEQDSSVPIILTTPPSPNGPTTPAAASEITNPQEEDVPPPRANRILLVYCEENIEEKIAELKNRHIQIDPALDEVIEFERPFIEVLRYEETAENSEEIRNLFEKKRNRITKMKKQHYQTKGQAYTSQDIVGLRFAVPGMELLRKQLLNSLAKIKGTQVRENNHAKWDPYIEIIDLSKSSKKPRVDRREIKKTITQLKSEIEMIHVEKMVNNEIMNRIACQYSFPFLGETSEPFQVPLPHPFKIGGEEERNKNFKFADSEQKMLPVEGKTSLETYGIILLLTPDLDILSIGYVLKEDQQQQYIESKT